MPLDLDTVRAWEHANEGGGELALSLQALRDGQDGKALSASLDHLHKARKALVASISLIDLQAATIGKALQVPK